MVSTTTHPPLAVGRAALDQLRVVLEREVPAQAAGLLREIGFSAGASGYDGFVGSIVDRYGVKTPQALDARYLGEALAGFFLEEGWGSVAVETLAPGLFCLNSGDWAEAEPRGAGAGGLWGRGRRRKSPGWRVPIRGGFCGRCLRGFS